MSDEFIIEDSIKIIKSDETFYNPAQEINRNLTKLVLKTYFKSVKEPIIFLAMEASGLRGILLHKELNDAKICINDILPEAVEMIKSNLKLNDIKEYKFVENKFNFDENRIYISQQDCVSLMINNSRCFNAIDIDPFGSSNVFIAAAINAVKNGGLLCFTCTDRGSLHTFVGKCFVKYDTKIKCNFDESEMGLRVLLSYISRTAAKYDCSIEPLISLDVDYYLRVFVKVKRGSGNNSKKQNSFFYFCNCKNRKESNTKNNLCEVCGEQMDFYGPFWNKNLQNSEFISSVLNELTETGENKRLIGMLKCMKQEIRIPFTYNLHDFGKVFKFEGIKLKKLMSVLYNSEYQVSLVHHSANSFKTNAPYKIIIDICRAIINKDSSKYNLNKNEEIENLFKVNYYRGLFKSNIGPGKILNK
ncbi:TRM1 [Hepatospora eriocheir]|uniref:tRNA (guanine(26)-N(2))-dimethyltransferase n=1 Tax=Hepatospora eriocheir TaxID=1081669 RepID=A0A1X0QJZ4_9MICR|nr:TRM1 [Hepatospora eriocheir]